MTTAPARNPVRFAASAATAALAGVAVASAIAFATGADGLAWGWLIPGWCAAAVPAIVGGVVLVRRHGASGHGFVKALLAGVIVRMIVAVVVGFVAVRVGGDAAIVPYVAGLAAGLLPVQIVEVAWFHRAMLRESDA